MSPPVFDEDVVKVHDELPGQLFLVGLFRDHRAPRPAEFVDEAGEGQDESLAEQGRLRSEVAEQQVFGHACRDGDLTGGGAAVILAGEEVTRGIEQQPTWLTAGPAGRRSRRRRLGALRGQSIGHGFSLLEP